MSSLSLAAVPVNGNNTVAALDVLSGGCSPRIIRVAVVPTPARSSAGLATCQSATRRSSTAKYIAIATEIYIEALPAVDLDDERWDNPGSYMTVDDLMDATAGRGVPRSTVVVPPELDDEFGDKHPLLM